MTRDSDRFSGRRQPYPPLTPYASGYLKVGEGHSVYWETCGNPNGTPALLLHGGPGGGCSANARRLFDPDRYRIILFDQRGCGRSVPHAGKEDALHANTTAHLVADMEALRRELGVERWLLLGGSWGAALALAYAQAHPEHVSAMVLRGVFTGRRSELDWLYRAGAASLFPEAWTRFIAPIPEGERGDLVAAYHVRLIGNSGIEAEHADGMLRNVARAWCAWEDAITTYAPCAGVAVQGDESAQIALARIEAHYMLHGCFLEEGQLIANAYRLSGIPGVIVQGRHDAVTPPVTAFELHRAWPRSELKIVECAGHASSQPGIMSGLIAATDAFARIA